MTDKEKLEKVYDYVQSKEDTLYNKIGEEGCEVGSMGAWQCMCQATAFQEIRYLIEDLMEK